MRIGNRVKLEASPAGIRPTMETTLEQLTISINSAARALGVGRSSIYSLIKQNRIEAIKIGRRTLLTTASIRRLADKPDQN